MSSSSWEENIDLSTLMNLSKPKIVESLELKHKLCLLKREFKARQLSVENILKVQRLRKRLTHPLETQLKKSLLSLTSMISVLTLNQRIPIS